MSADPKELSALGAPEALLWVLYLVDLFKFTGPKPHMHSGL